MMGEEEMLSSAFGIITSTDRRSLSIIFYTYHSNSKIIIKKDEGNRRLTETLEKKKKDRSSSICRRLALSILPS